MKLHHFQEGYSYMSESNPQPEQKVVDKFARVADSQRSYYIMKWAEEKGMDTDDAMHKAGYIKDGYLGAGAYNWRYVGMDESVQEADDEVDTGPTWKDDLEDALDGYPEWAHEYIKDGVCPECGGNGYMDGDYENEDGEENDECNGMYNYDCDEGEIRDNTWADKLKSKEPEAPKQPAPSKEQIMKLLPMLHKEYVQSGRYNAFELGSILKQMYPELNKRLAGSYVADFFKTFEEDMDEVAGAKDCWDGYKKDGTQAGTGKNKGKRVNKCVKEDDLDEKGPNYDASDIHRGDAITCKPCGGKGCDHCDYKGVHAKDETTQESAPVEFDNDSNEAHVSKMLAKALGDDNKWSEMSAPELYAELESTNPEVADMLHKVAMTIYDVKLKERAYKDVGVADTVKDQRGKEFNFDKGSKKFKSQDGEEADVTTKLGKDLMRQRKNHMKRTSPSYPKNKR